MWTVMEIAIKVIGALLALGVAITGVGRWFKGDKTRAIQYWFLSIVSIAIVAVPKSWVQDMYLHLSYSGIGIAFILAVLFAMAGGRRQDP